MMEDSVYPHNNWTVKQARNALLVVLLASAFFLIFRSIFLSPNAPQRPYIISKTSDKEVLKSLEWYSQHSIGSLKLDENRCVVESADHRVLCKNALEVKKAVANFPDLTSLKNDKANWPYLWLTKAYDKEVMVEFALFELKPIKIISQKERLTVLGTELVVEVEFKKAGISKVAMRILDPKEIENIEGEKGAAFVATIALLPNPYGYYLPIYPLP